MYLASNVYIVSIWIPFINAVIAKSKQALPKRCQCDSIKSVHYFQCVKDLDGLLFSAALQSYIRPWQRPDALQLIRKRENKLSELNFDPLLSWNILLQKLPS